MRPGAPLTFLKGKGLKSGPWGCGSLFLKPEVEVGRPQATTQAGGVGAGAGLHSPENRRTEIWTEPRLHPLFPHSPVTTSKPTVSTPVVRHPVRAAGQETDLA